MTHELRRLLRGRRREARIDQQRRWVYFWLWLKLLAGGIAVGWWLGGRP